MFVSLIHVCKIFEIFCKRMYCEILKGKSNHSNRQRCFCLLQTYSRVHQKLLVNPRTWNACRDGGSPAKGLFSTIHYLTTSFCALKLKFIWVDIGQNFGGAQFLRQVSTQLSSYLYEHLNAEELVQAKYRVDCRLHSFKIFSKVSRRTSQSRKLRFARYVKTCFKRRLIFVRSSFTASGIQRVVFAWMQASLKYFTCRTTAGNGFIVARCVWNHYIGANRYKKFWCCGWC